MSKMIHDIDIMKVTEIILANGSIPMEIRRDILNVAFEVMGALSMRLVVNGLLQSVGGADGFIALVEQINDTRLNNMKNYLFETGSFLNIEHERSLKKLDLFMEQFSKISHVKNQ